MSILRARAIRAGRDEASRFGFSVEALVADVIVAASSGRFWSKRGKTWTQLFAPWQVDALHFDQHEWVVKLLMAVVPIDNAICHLAYERTGLRQLCSVRLTLPLPLALDLVELCERDRDVTRHDTRPGSLLSTCDELLVPLGGGPGWAALCELDTSPEGLRCAEAIRCHVTATLTIAHFAVRDM